MSVFLQSLLGAKEPMFTSGLIKLEKSTGNSGVDTRLIADITEKAHDIMRQLRLDVRDTTAKELYHALMESVRCGIAERMLADSDYVLIRLEDKLISFNMIDVIENVHHELPFSRQIVSHGQRSLRGELVSRYAKHSRTDNRTTHEIAKSAGLIDENEA